MTYYAMLHFIMLTCVCMYIYIYIYIIHTGVYIYIYNELLTSALSANDSLTSQHFLDRVQRSTIISV